MKSKIDASSLLLGAFIGAVAVLCVAPTTTQEKTPLEKLFEGEKLFTAPPALDVTSTAFRNSASLYVKALASKTGIAEVKTRLGKITMTLTPERVNKSIAFVGGISVLGMGLKLLPLPHLPAISLAIFALIAVIGVVWLQRSGFLRRSTLIPLLAVQLLTAPFALSQNSPQLQKVYAIYEDVFGKMQKGQLPFTLAIFKPVIDEISNVVDPFERSFALMTLAGLFDSGGAKDVASSLFRAAFEAVRLMQDETTRDQALFGLASAVVDRPGDNQILAEQIISAIKDPSISSAAIIKHRTEEHELIRESFGLPIVKTPDGVSMNGMINVESQFSTSLVTVGINTNSVEVFKPAILKAREIVDAFDRTIALLDIANDLISLKADALAQAILKESANSINLLTNDANKARLFYRLTTIALNSSYFSVTDHLLKIQSPAFQKVTRTAVALKKKGAPPVPQAPSGALPHGFGEFKIFQTVEKLGSESIKTNTFDPALTEIRAAADTDAKAEAVLSIALMFHQMHFTEKFEELLGESLEIARRIPQETPRSHTYQHIALYIAGIGRYDQALAIADGITVWFQRNSLVNKLNQMRVEAITGRPVTPTKAASAGRRPFETINETLKNLEADIDAGRAPRKFESYSTVIAEARSVADPAEKGLALAPIALMLLENNFTQRGEGILNEMLVIGNDVTDPIGKGRIFSSVQLILKNNGFIAQAAVVEKLIPGLKAREGDLPIETIETVDENVKSARTLVDRISFDVYAGVKPENIDSFKPALEKIRAINPISYRANLLALIAIRLSIFNQQADAKRMMIEALEAALQSENSVLRDAAVGSFIGTMVEMGYWREAEKYLKEISEPKVREEYKQKLEQKKK